MPHPMQSTSQSQSPTSSSMRMYEIIKLIKNHPPEQILDQRSHQKAIHSQVNSQSNQCCFTNLNLSRGTIFEETSKEKLWVDAVDEKNGSYSQELIHGSYYKF